MKRGRIFIAKTSLGTINVGNKLRLVSFVNDKVVMERLKDRKKYRVSRSNWHKFTELASGENIISERAGHNLEKYLRNECEELKPHDRIIRDVEDILNKAADYKVTRRETAIYFVLKIAMSIINRTLCYGKAVILHTLSKLNRILLEKAP